MKSGLHRLGIVLLGLSACYTARAQETAAVSQIRHFSDEEIAAVAMPALAFTEKPEDIENYDRYFYFYRPDTSFDEAYADILECDALSSGLAKFSGGMGLGELSRQMSRMQGPLAGALGAAMGQPVLEAIAGPVERRRIRRINMRTCMHFKGYSRFGLSKGLWEGFNREDGGRRADKPEERDRLLLARARVASGAAPVARALIP
jgi:hypothetical protein